MIFCLCLCLSTPPIMWHFQLKLFPPAFQFSCEYVHKPVTGMTAIILYLAYDRQISCSSFVDWHRRPVCVVSYSWGRHDTLFSIHSLTAVWCINLTLQVVIPYFKSLFMCVRYLFLCLVAWRTSVTGHKPTNFQVDDNMVHGYPHMSTL